MDCAAGFWPLVPKWSMHTCTHTLAQNNHCEFWCGTHLTCKNTPIIPDRNGSMTRPEKVSKRNHRQLEADTSLSTKPNRSHPDRLRKPYRRWSDIKWNLQVWVWFETVWKNDMPVLGLAGCHWREMEIGAGTQVGAPICITRSNGCLCW